MLEINKIVYSNYRELTNKINNYHYEGYKIIKLDLLDDGTYRLEFTLVGKYYLGILYLILIIVK